MIYSDTIRMACLECLLGHKSKSCTHIRKIKNGRVYVIEDRGRHKASPIISNYRSVPQARCSAIRVVAGEEVFPTNDFCDRTMDSVYCCICLSCKKARRGRMSVFLDPSTLQLANETSPSEELQSKFKKWKGMKVDCENKTVATNLPDSCHLMAIHDANYMDHIKIFESGAEIAGVIKQNLEKKDIYAGEKRPLDERSPYFSDSRFNPYYKKPIEISPDLDTELSQSVGDILKEAYSNFEEPTLGVFHSQQPIGRSSASPGYDEVPYAAEQIAKDHSNEQLFRVQAYNRDLPRNTNFISNLYNQGGWDPYLSHNHEIERNDDLIDPLLTSGGSHDHEAGLVQDREVQMIPLDVGALIEPLSVVHHAIELSGFKAGEDALVLGSGPIGLATLLILQAKGASQVIVSEPASIRREQAVKLGAIGFNPAEHGQNATKELRKLGSRGEGFAKSFDCSGIPVTYSTSIHALRAHGVACNVAIWPHKSVAHYVMDVTLEEKTSLGSLGYQTKDFKGVIELLESGKLDIEKVKTLITGKVGLKNGVAQGFEELINQKDKHIKILISPTIDQ